MKDNVIRTKSFAFALRIVKLYQYLQLEKKEFILSKQLLRSGTSIGAMVRESEQAESKPDFIHKLAIAQKEANETEYWIELLYQSGYLDKKQYESVFNDITEIRKLLTSIIKTSKQRKPN
ncbi:MAG TPA: four helix bundle protein [Niabella sp.]|nr:four helix bundle protein [Niabella sp.]HQW15474.1 four helix bundle protein [Niabella sp.]HQX20616.1 four helix bundle protein [Niabella sp.]HRB07020.1 four helix bundle protein [Niabella sp.]HRB35826.1 four helix bundle protein [Niabella sp.]